MAQIQKEFPQEVRIVYRHFPLTSIHDKSELAAQASEAAGKQGKFFEFQTALFVNQQAWSAKSLADFTPWLNDQAKTLGLNVDQFTADLTSPDIVEKIKQAEKDGAAIGVPGTPYLLVNGSALQVNPTYEVLKAIIELSRMKNQMVNECPPMSVDPTKTYHATLTTTRGDITIELLPKKAPLAVNIFIYLARKGYYDNTIFHRVLTGFVAQGGDPSGTGFGGPGFVFGNEINADQKFDQEGQVGMANSGPDSNGAQFFITYAPQTMLDGKYTIFGKVTAGMENAKKITPRDTSQGGTIPEADKIIKITIEEK